MTSLRSELPDDLKSCHALIAQLQAELRAATEQFAKLQGKADEAQDATEQVAHLEALLAKYQETIADQQQTIENLAAVRHTLDAACGEAAAWMIQISRGNVQMDRLRFAPLQPSFLVGAVKPA